MSPTKRAARSPAPSTVDDDEEEPPPEGNDDSLVLGEIFADLPASVRVKVWRIPEHGEKEWCWTGEPSKATEELLAKFGPGEYMLHARGTLPNGKRDAIRRTARIRIAAMPQPPVPAAPASGPPGSFADQIAQTAILGLLEQMQRANREHSTAMAVLLERIAKPQHDPLLQTLLEKSLGGRQADPLEQALRINELTGKARSTSGVAELIGTLDALDRIKARVRGKSDDDEDSGGGWASVFRELIPRILPAEQSNDNSAPASGGVTAPVPAPIAGSRAPAPALILERSPVARIPAHLAPLAPYFPQLVAAAERNVPAEQTADFILALLPDAALEVAESVLAGDTLVTEITTAEPQLAAHGQYVDAVRRAMLEQLKSWPVEGEGTEGGDDTAAA